MKASLLSLLVISIVALVVMAVVFRNQRARGILRFARNTAWVYVVVIVVLGAWRIYEQGGL
jgi:Sec-independent protein translocase protein TatA